MPYALCSNRRCDYSISPPGHGDRAVDCNAAELSFLWL